MAREPAPVKDENDAWWLRLLGWCDGHPRFAWMLALSAHLNIILTVWVFR